MREHNRVKERNRRRDITLARQYTEDRLDALGRRIPVNNRRVVLEKVEAQRDILLERGACTRSLVDPAWFHSEKDSDIRAAIAVCRSCSVTDECLEYQHVSNSPGVWGGVRWDGVGRDGRIRADRRFFAELPL
jgi:hypothetical protein